MDDKKLISGFTAAATIAFFTYSVFTGTEYFSDSFLYNLVEVPLLLFGSFLIVGAVVFIPGFFISMFLQKAEEIENNGHKKASRVLIVGACVAVVVILALIAQNLKQGN